MVRRFLVQGRSTRDKLRELLCNQPVLQHRIELYVGLIDYLQRSFLTGVQKELRNGDDVIARWNNFETLHRRSLSELFQRAPIVSWPSWMTWRWSLIRTISESLGETEEKKIEDESQINLWYLQIKSTVNEKKENIKKLFLGDTAASINQVKPTMNTIFVVNDFMNGSYKGRIFRISRFIRKYTRYKFRNFYSD